MSAHTLSAYLRMFLNNGSPILHPRSIAEIRTVVGCGVIPPYNQSMSNNTIIQRHLEYDLGWYRVTTKNADRFIGHAGELPGLSHVMLVNKKNAGVILLSNADANAPVDLTREIWETYKNIYVSLFQCFDSDLVPASAFCTKPNLFRLIIPIFLLSCVVII